MNPALPVFRAYLAEVIGTFALVFAGTGAMIVDDLFGGVVTSVGIAVAIGATVCFAALFGGPVSGASMNPARSLAPALVSGALTAQWIYVVAPLLGAALAVFAYRGVYGHATRPPASVSHEPLP